MPEDINNKPLTIKDIREALIPAMEEVFATKQDLENFVNREEFIEFKDKSLSNQDKIIKDLETLLIEKTVGDYQQKKQRQLWAIVIDALREHKILSPDQLQQIKELEVL